MNSPAASRASRPPTRRSGSGGSSSIDITGIAASAKIELDYPEIFFTDYFLLLKVDGEWKIIDKIADSRRRTPAALVGVALTGSRGEGAATRAGA